MSQGSSEKTEKPSSRRKRDARKKGNVSKSQDLVSAGAMIVLFAVINGGIEGFILRLGEFTTSHLSGSYINTYANRLTADSLHEMFSDTLLRLLSIILPLLLVAMLAGCVLHVAQTGFLFTTDKLKPDFKKINPIEGFKRIFSSATLMELFKSVVKITILTVVIYKTMSANLGAFKNLAYIRPGYAFLSVFQICAKMGVTIGAALFAFAVADVIYQWWKLQKDLRMTKQEVKEEQKQEEGDPQVKGRIRQIQRQMSRRRMMNDLLQADVVVTNPTHYAVALRYREKEDPAPIILAKGQGYLALRIKKVAAEHKITIVENKPVARALYAACEIGQTVPASLYQAIADILIYVYQVTNKLPKR